MPLGSKRQKVLYGLSDRRPRVHRYTLIRWAVGVACTVAVALVPLSGLLRLDLWRGHHVVLGGEAGLVEALKAFAFPFLAINILILVSIRFLGRYLCGFVCPVGSLARLAEWLDWRQRRGVRRWLATGVLLAICTALGAVTFTFWVDWAVFREGSPLAQGLAAAFLVGVVALLLWMTRRLQLDFCQRWCPCGAYFSVLGRETLAGIHFAHPDQCTDCAACDKVCPMDLHPRTLPAEGRPGRGFYATGVTNHGLCIRCGDCVQACDGMRRRSDRPVILTLGILPPPAPEPQPAPEPGSAS